MKDWDTSGLTMPLAIARRWSNLNITTKFNAAFGGFFSLILLVSSTSYLFSSAIRRQTEAAIFTSTEIQQRVLEMDAALQTARVHERDFFLRYTETGFVDAQTEYAAAAVGNIADVIRLGQELEPLINSSHISHRLQQQNIDLKPFFYAADQYQETLLETIELVTQLAGEDSGLWYQLEQISDELRQQIEQTGDAALIGRYYEMIIFEKNYRITSGMQSMESALDIASDIQQRMDTQVYLDALNRERLQSQIQRYTALFSQIAQLNRSIQDKLQEFDRQANQVDPIFSNLIRVLNAEVKRAQNRVYRTSQWANTNLGIIVISGLLLASVIARVLTHSITQRVIHLNRAVQQLQKGNLNVRTTMGKEIESMDELGHLSRSFNQMAHQLQTIFNELETTNDQLEQRVRDRTLELSDTVKQLQKTQAQLVQTEKMSSLGQMVAGVAHEINNPVSFIYGNISPAYEYIDELLHLIQLYKAHYPAPETEIKHHIETIDLDFVQQDLLKLLDSIREGAVRIREIVKSLRIFSRLDEAEFKDVDLHAGLDSTLMLLHNRLKYANKQEGITIKKQYGPLPTVNCYPGQLNQVFMNILSNAIDALEMHQPKVLAEVHCGGDTALMSPPAPDRAICIATDVVDHVWALIQISDNGPGMPDHVREHLFDPFFTTKPIGKGTGLGLSVSYQIIVERHKGQLWCESNPGQGTTFKIKIPINQML